MRYILWVLLIINVAYADTCPPIKNLNPNKPPAGWTLQIPPIIDGQDYYFGETIHSLNGSFYFKQIICKYQACSSAFCPAFSLLSNAQYQQPATSEAPWNAKSKIAATYTCRPVDHDPANCVFQ